MVVFGQKLMYWDNSACIRANVVELVQNLLFSKNWLYLGKAVVFGQKWYYSGKVVVFGQKVVLFGQMWL